MLILLWMAAIPGWVSALLNASFPHASFGTCVQNRAERFPAAATPSLQLHLAPDHVAGFGGIDLDSRKRGREHDMTERLCLSEDIFSRKIIPALLEYPLENHALHVAGQ